MYGLALHGKVVVGPAAFDVHEVKNTWAVDKLTQHPDGEQRFCPVV
jgi:hypothetical protein